MRTKQTDLTPGQWNVFWRVEKSTGVTVSELLESGGFSPDPWFPGAITGILPHCGLYGLIEPSGACHT